MFRESRTVFLVIVKSLVVQYLLRQLCETETPAKNVSLQKTIASVVQHKLQM